MKNLILLLLITLVFACSSDNSSPYGDLMEYLIENSDLKVSTQRTPSMNTKSGYVHRGITGNSSWKWLDDDGSSISIRYSVLSVSADEVGEVTNMKIVSNCGFINCSGYFPVSLEGKYKPNGSAGGKFRVSFSSTSPTVKFNLFYDSSNGVKAQSWAEVKLHKSFEEYLKKLDDLNIIDYETAGKISLEEKKILTNPPLLDFYSHDFAGTSGETIEIELNFTNNGGSNLKIFDITGPGYFNFDEDVLIEPGEKYVIPVSIKIPENLDAKNYSPIPVNLTFNIKTNDKSYNNDNIYVKGNHFSSKNAERLFRLKTAAKYYREGLINEPKKFQIALNYLSEIIKNGPYGTYSLGAKYLMIITKLQLGDNNGAMEIINDLSSWYRSNENNNNYYFDESGLSNIYYDMNIMTGIIAYRSGFKDVTERAFKLAIQTLPEKAEAWSWLSMYYYVHNNTEEAIKSINKQLKYGNTTDILSGLNFRAKINSEQKNYAAALKDYNEIIKLNSLSKETYLLRHEIKKLLNDIDGAEDDLNTFKDLESFKPTHLITGNTNLYQKPQYPSPYDDSYDKSLDIGLEVKTECQLIESYGNWLRVKTQNLDVGFVHSPNITTIDYNNYSPYTSKPKCGEERVLNYLSKYNNIIVFQINVETVDGYYNEHYDYVEKRNHVTYKYWDIDYRTVGSITRVLSYLDSGCDNLYSIQNFGRKL